ncbi:extracellular solute-binding protein [Pseudoruegeria sp. HB172150]|uniref:extracellular solute-binding protein n=1 Tax=Pseudoruegeria sp. HB172150 TaxID=2721164 RepID=UPI0015523FDC|nr:extracellular solute-binding protein [Pseudoruegeria sp. HB172150]
MPSNALTRREVVAGAAGLSAAALLPARALANDTTVTISSPWGADRPFQQVVDAFNAKGTGVQVVNRLDGDYQEMATKALASIAAGRPPEMMITGWKFGYFASRTLGARDFNEIDAAKAEAIISQFKPQVHDLVNIDGKLIGLPWAMSTPVTWINMDLWREAGLDEDIPMDVSHEWLMEKAAAIEEALGGGSHPTYRSALDLSNNEWTSQAYIQNAGGYIIHGDDVVCDSPEAVAGMAAFAEPVQPGLWKNLDYRAQAQAQIGGAIAIVCTSSARSSSLLDAGYEFKDVMFPSLGGTRNMNSGGNFLAIYARDEELAQASMTFLEFCASKEGQEIWSKVGYLNTSVHDIAPLPLQDAGYAQLAEGLTAETIWPGERGLEGQDVWRQWVARVLEGEVPAEEGMIRAKAELTPLIG